MVIQYISKVCSGELHGDPDQGGTGNKIPATAVRKVGLSGLAGVSTLALLASFPGAAFAQQAPEPSQTADAIVVTGIRHGLAESIDKKKNSLSIIESITAEDIGKLPAVSIADSLAQVPGLALQRVDGRAQLATVRGFGPDYTASFLNDRPIASARFSRAVSFDQFPSELLAGVDVYKTPNLDLAGMGLGGTIDLKTVRPLESKNTFAFNVKGVVNSLGHVNPDVSNKGYNANATYIHKFADDTIGFSIGYAHMDSPEAIQHTKDWYFGSNPGSVTPAAAASDQFLEGFEATATSRRLVRDGVASALEWKPNDKIHNTLDMMYSQFYQQETVRTIEGFANPSANANGSYTGVTTATVGGSAVAQSGTLNNWNADILQNSNPEKEWLFAIGDKFEYAPSSKVKFALDLSYSQDHDKQSQVQTQAGYLNPTGSAMPFNQTDTLGFNVPFGGNAFPQFSTGLNYASASNIGLGDPGTSAWGGWGQDGIIHDYDIKDKVYTADLGGRYEVNSGLFENFDFGVNYEHHSKVKTIVEDNLYLLNNRAPTAIAASDFVGSTNLGFAGLGPIAAYNINDVLNQYYNIVPFTDNNSVAKQWRLTEDFVTARAKLTINSGRWHGDVGTQLVFTKQQSSGGGQVTVPSAYVPQGVANSINTAPLASGASYVNFLPNLNLIYDVQDGARPLKLRISVGRTMQKPRTDDMIANYSISLGSQGSCGYTKPTQLCWSGSGGNPQLRPWQATGIDVSIEKYMGGATHFVLAGFYKHMDNFQTTLASNFNYGVFPLPGTVTIPAGYTVNNAGVYTQPVNGTGGNVWGMEVSGSVDFGKFVPALDGFGATASYAYTGSSTPATATDANGNLVTISANGVSGQMAGLSKNVFEVTAFYEKNGIQARMNYHYRTPYIGEFGANFGNVGPQYVLTDKQMDMQIGYTFPKTSSLHGLSFTAQAQNILNSAYADSQNSNGLPTSTLANGQALPQAYEKYGRTYMIGFGYKF